MGRAAGSGNRGTGSPGAGVSQRAAAGPEAHGAGCGAAPLPEMGAGRAGWDLRLPPVLGQRSPGASYGLKLAASKLVLGLILALIRAAGKPGW